MMTRTDAINFINNQIKSRGMEPGAAEIEDGHLICRILGKDLKTVCGSVTVTDNEIKEGDTNAITHKVLAALRAAIKEPVLKGLK